MLIADYHSPSLRLARLNKKRCVVSARLPATTSRIRNTLPVLHTMAELGGGAADAAPDRSEPTECAGCSNIVTQSVSAIQLSGNPSRDWASKLVRRRCPPFD